MPPKQDTLRHIITQGQPELEYMPEEQLLELIGRILGYQLGVLPLQEDTTMGRPDSMSMDFFTRPESGLRNLLLGHPTARDSIDSLINSDASGLRNLLLGRDIR
jgi:hypothetical protein